jgi:hypothetical protein
VQSLTAAAVQSRCAAQIQALLSENADLRAQIVRLQKPCPDQFALVAVPPSGPSPPPPPARGSSAPSPFVHPPTAPPPPNLSALSLVAYNPFAIEGNAPACAADPPRVNPFANAPPPPSSRADALEAEVAALKGEVAYWRGKCDDLLLQNAFGFVGESAHPPLASSPSLAPLAIGWGGVEDAALVPGLLATPQAGGGSGGAVTVDDLLSFDVSASAGKVDGGRGGIITEKAALRERAVKELLETERTYVAHLNLIFEVRGGGQGGGLSRGALRRPPAADVRHPYGHLIFNRRRDRFWLDSYSPIDYLGKLEIIRRVHVEFLKVF